VTQHHPAAGDERSRTHTWPAPVPLSAVLTGPEAATTSGLDLMRMLLDGRLPPPPIASTVSMRLTDAGPGTAVFEGDPGEHLLNPMGTVHGGWLATLLDSALGCAVLTALPPGTAYTTAQLNLNLLRPVTATTATLRCEGTALHVGRTTATAEARVTGVADGKLYAHATTTCAVFPVGPPPPAAG
jgi:uncharacterized protein (TIGR00369 family)